MSAPQVYGDMGLLSHSTYDFHLSHNAGQTRQVLGVCCFGGDKSQLRMVPIEGRVSCLHMQKSCDGWGV
jgi:hypothetical protein